MGEVNLDGMHMFTDELSAAMNALEAAGAVKDRWAVQHGAILALESQLGGGPIGRAFAASYNATEGQLVEATESMVAAPGTTAATGRVCIQNYLTAEDQNRDRLEAV